MLISHSPPKGLVDVSSTGISLGSFAVLRAIESKEPRLVICGHIHESSGKKVTHGKTVVLNAGPGGMIVEI